MYSRFFVAALLAGLLVSCKSNSTVATDSHELIKFSQDTLDFGVDTVGSAKSLTLTVSNIGNVAVKILTVIPNTVNSPYSVSGLPVTITQNYSSSVTVTLLATSAGSYLEQFNVTTDDGSVFHFYAKNNAVGKGGSGGDDPVVYSFVVMGCNRLDKGDFLTTASTNPSSANVDQLKRTFADIAALDPKPKFFFAAGDLVLGHTDSLSLVNQLVAWKALWEASPAKAAGIELVAVTGNHETEDLNKNPQAFGEGAWLNVFAPYTTRGGNGPVPHNGDPDKLITDQSKLTYSFDFNDAYFIVISTDPAGLSSTPPANWIASDIFKAHSNPATKHIFAIGHKPAYSFDGDPSNGLAANLTNRDLFWNAMESNNAEAMLSAHNHTYKAFRPNGKTWMVIAGNGGSSLESTAPLFFGFTLVQVLKSGTVIEKSYGRNFGPNYNSPSPVATYPTTLRDSNVISWK